MKPIKLAIVILNWNGCAMMRRFLPSVIRHSDMEGVNVFVADNHSTDDSLSMLQKEFPTVELILLDKNYGFAEGYNRALRRIEATYYLLLNSDVKVTPGWLPPLLDYMDTHPQVAACQPKLLSLCDKENGVERFEYSGACGGLIDHYGYPFCRGRIMSHVENDYGQYDTVCPVFWASGAALLVRASDYWKHGGLDGRFFAHMEEIDFCWRLRSRGRDIVCIPSSKVYHVGGGTLNKENPRKTYLNFRNNLLMLYKNLPEKDLRPVMRIRRWLDYVAALSFWLKGERDSARAVFQARQEFKQMMPSYADDRQENLRQTVLPSIPERMQGSILWNYYARRRNRFNQLSWSKR